MKGAGDVLFPFCSSIAPILPCERSALPKEPSETSALLFLLPKRPPETAARNFVFVAVSKECLRLAASAESGSLVACGSDGVLAEPAETTCASFALNCFWSKH